MFFCALNNLGKISAFFFLKKHLFLVQKEAVVKQHRSSEGDNVSGRGQCDNPAGKAQCHILSPDMRNQENGRNSNCEVCYKG